MMEARLPMLGPFLKLGYSLVELLDEARQLHYLLCQVRLGINHLSEVVQVTSECLLERFKPVLGLAGFVRHAEHRTRVWTSTRRFW